MLWNLIRFYHNLLGSCAQRASSFPQVGTANPGLVGVSGGSAGVAWVRPREKADLSDHRLPESVVEAPDQLWPHQ